MIFRFQPYLVLIFNWKWSHFQNKTKYSFLPGQFMMAISITISEMYFHPCFVQSIYVDNPVLSEPLFGGAENFPYFIPSILLLPYAILWASVYVQLFIFKLFIVFSTSLNHGQCRNKSFLQEYICASYNHFTENACF